MKEINPETGKIWKQGDVRLDGKIFKSYRYERLKNNGYYSLAFYNPKSFNDFTTGRKLAKNKLYNFISAFIYRVKERRGCKVCGIKMHHSFLQFDHIYPKTKPTNVSEIYRPSLNLLKKRKKEIRKCRVVCMKCHYEIHKGDRRKKMSAKNVN